jgi:hypothetical protein
MPDVSSSTYLNKPPDVTIGSSLIYSLDGTGRLLKQKITRKTMNFKGGC